MFHDTKTFFHSDLLDYADINIVEKKHKTKTLLCITEQIDSRFKLKREKLLPNFVTLTFFQFFI